MLRRFIGGEFPMVPNLRMPAVDVRDIALACLAAIETSDLGS